ncbi:MAG TPA: imidazolonepropionase [Candidatus Cloacimonadota bacterium]|nr:imidazolonepropionase [Candidatus Cloacimonadota bacterium]HQL15110.1 imidazolonepropionase [Candidatus Cloacimonadota bacterium]
MKTDLVLSNADELVCVSLSGKPLFGKECQDIDVLRHHSIAVHRDMIIAIGPAEEIASEFDPISEIDCSGKVITPGLVDAHTHPIFVHTREDEFEQRLLGKSYVEISQSGGGILSTIRTTRHASEEELFKLAYKRLEKMLFQGTTTIEAKSGYGLTTESELKQLKVIGELADKMPLDVVPTFLGAHEFPEEYKDKHDAYIRILCEEMLPAVAEQGIAKFCDIFTEAHTYNLTESRKILSKAKELNLKLKIHADELEPIGGAELAAEMGCTSADHLARTSVKGIHALKNAGVVPVLLPATVFSLGSTNYAPAREMMATGLPVALATDFNPGSCNCDSLPLVMALACLQMKMTPAEVLAACTINAAAAIDLEQKVGSVTVGKQADLLIWDIPSYKYLPYHLGSSFPQTVIKSGRIVDFPLPKP